MTQVNTDGLPPEMQQRIADIIEKAKATAPQQPAQQAPAAPVRQPSLMDHTIALRQEVNALRQELQAVAQVVDACGQAVGQLYATFQATTAPTNYGAAYEAQTPVEDGDY